jgi:hypothetical protein
MPAAAPPTKFRRVALIGKLKTPEIEAALREMRELVQARGCEVLSEGARCSPRRASWCATACRSSASTRGASAS